MNRLPDITRNETEMEGLRNATLRVERASELQKVLKPRILLLSQKKGTFRGLNLPDENSEDMEMRENAKKIKE